MRGDDGSSPRSTLYYGWIIAGVLAITETTSWGILFYSFSVMMPQMEAELGWSRAQTSGAFSLALLISGLAAVFVGRWLDRHGAQLLMTAGSLIGTLLVIAWAQVQTLPQLYLIWAGIGLIMAAVLYEPAFAVLARWFITKRRKALTILTLMAGLASTIFIPLSQYLIEEVGWRTSLMILAGILAFVTIPLHAIFLRRSPQDIGLSPDGEEALHLETVNNTSSVPPEVALRHITFWALVAALVFNTFSSAVLAVHLLSYLLEGGYSAAFAAGLAGFIGGMQVPGRLFFSVIGTKLPRSFITIAVFLMQMIGFLALLYVDTRVGIFVVGALLGMSGGMVTLLRASLIAEFFGTAHYGKLNGVVGLFTSSTRGIAPVTAGLLYVYFSSYVPVLWLLTILAGLAVVFAYIAELESRKLHKSSLLTTNLSIPSEVQRTV